MKGAPGGRALPEIALIARISGSQDYDMIVTTCRTLHSARAANRKVGVSHTDARLEDKALRMMVLCLRQGWFSY